MTAKEAVTLYAVWNNVMIVVTGGIVTGGEQYRPTDSYGKGDNYPAYYVNWYEAVIYCNLRSAAEGLTPAYYMTISGVNTTDIEAWANESGTNIEKLQTESTITTALVAVQNLIAESNSI